MMQTRWAFALVLAACGTTSQQAPVAHAPAHTPAPAVAQAEPAPPRVETPVKISGIEGSMSSYDVRATMDKRGAALGACHEPRARVVPALSGTIEFAIAVSGEGAVSEVSVASSDLGDRTLERCVSQVIAETAFPRPNGGDARVTWTMILEPTRASAAAEPWDRERIAKVLDKKLPELREECSVNGGGQFDVTAYVNKRGRVVAAGVTSRRAAKPEDLDCIVSELRSWSMPRPKTSRFAKVTFGLGSVGDGRTLARRR
jgi:hypothetical protein